MMIVAMAYASGENVIVEHHQLDFQQQLLDLFAKKESLVIFMEV